MTLPTPRLVPAPEEIQAGYELTLEERMIRGAPMRLFTFPGGSEDVARTVVCLPGLGASGRSFAPMAPLAPHLRLRLWTPALHTPETDTQLQWNVESLAHPDTQLPERFALVGSSFGSLVSLAFTLAHPERLRALVLVSPVASVHRVRRWALSLSTDVLDADYLGALERLRVPTLIIHGARDTLVPLRYAQDVARRIPGSRLEVLREASHLPYMSHAQSFNAIVGDFLLQHLSREPEN
jgi:pimeloyl-ACP methyl ester carboxylesterase